MKKRYRSLVVPFFLLAGITFATSCGTTKKAYQATAGFVDKATSKIPYIGGKDEYELQLPEDMDPELAVKVQRLDDKMRAHPLTSTATWRYFLYFNKDLPLDQLGQAAAVAFKAANDTDGSLRDVVSTSVTLRKNKDFFTKIADGVTDGAYSLTPEPENEEADVSRGLWSLDPGPDEVRDDSSIPGKLIPDVPRETTDDDLSLFPDN